MGDDTRGVDHRLQQSGPQFDRQTLRVTVIAGSNRLTRHVDQERMGKFDVRERSRERIDRRRTSVGGIGVHRSER